MAVALILVCLLCACSSTGHEGGTPEASPMMMAPDPSTAAREEMVARDIASRGITDERVLAAMREVPRHRFVPPELAVHAYEDRPLPIGHRQTISQPYIVAFMTEAVRPQPTDRALDIGTGSGYHAAVLSRLVARVDSLDIVCPLADEARHRLRSLGYDNVEVGCGDGWAGKEERAPFDIIVVAAAPEVVPRALLEQLANGGRMIIPVGPQTFEGQELRLIEKDAAGVVSERTLLAVRFVPMTGRPR